MLESANRRAVATQHLPPDADTHWNAPVVREVVGLTEKVYTKFAAAALRARGYEPRTGTWPVWSTDDVVIFAVMKRLGALRYEPDDGYRLADLIVSGRSDRWYEEPMPALVSVIDVAEVRRLIHAGLADRVPVNRSHKKYFVARPRG